jgi:hypothetical protein
MRILATRPSAWIRFQTTGKLPQGVKPKSPLITLLKALSPRDLETIRGLRIGPTLGYNGAHTFTFARQALRWICPSDEVFGAFPAQSWQLVNFQKPLYLEDLASCCAVFPESLFSRYPQLCKSRPAQVSSGDATNREPDSQG